MPEEFDDELQEMFEDPKRREKTLSNEVLRLPIKALRLQEAITVSASATIQAAIEKMQEHKTGCVLLVESNRLVSIFTERDVLYKVIGKFPDLSSVAVSACSTKNPETLQMSDNIGQALNLMHVGGYRHIPVVNVEGEPIAVVSMKDAVAFLSEFFPEDVLNVPARPLRTTSEREGA